MPQSKLGIKRMPNDPENMTKAIKAVITNDNEKLDNKFGKLAKSTI